MRKFDVPPIWTLIALLSVVIINYYWPEPSLNHYFFKALGFALMVCAVIFAAWAFYTFKAAQTPYYPRKRPKKLLTGGPFSFSRNPIYVAMVFFVLGVAFLGGSIYGFIFVIGLFFLLRQRFVEPEEALLLENFEEETKDYFAKTRRWI